MDGEDVHDQHLDQADPMHSEPHPQPPLAQRTRELMADGRPRGLEEIARALGQPVPTDDDACEDLEFTLGLDAPRYGFMGDTGRFVDLPVLLDGRVFTYAPARVRRTGEGAAHLTPLPDLDLLLQPAAGESIPLTGGGHATWAGEGPEPELVIPGAVLDGVDEGQVLGLTWAGDTLTVRAVQPDATGTERITEALGAACRLACPGDEDCVELGDLLLGLLLDDADAFRTPVAPVGELLDAAGISRQGDYVGPAERDWLVPFERVRREREALNTSVYGFEECCHQALDTLRLAFTRHVIGDGAPELRQAAVAADHGEVAEAFMAELMADMPADLRDECLGPFADALIAAHTPPGAGALFLRATAHELTGDPLQALRHLERAAAADPGHQATLAELACMAEDAGDAAAAIGYLRRLGAPADDPQMTRLHAAPTPRATGTPRNAPCPCGSGRKYKVCCLRNGRAPLLDRGPWLYEKAASFIHRPGERPLLIALGEVLCAGDPAPDALMRAVHDPFLMDVALFEEGGLEHYLLMRGSLLPDDERELAERWCDCPRALFEVTAAHDRALELRDTRDGAVHIVGLDHHGRAARHVGDLLLGRVCPHPDGTHLVGPHLNVDLRHRDTLLHMLDHDDLTGGDWLHWMAQATAPPRLANTEGEPLVFCEARFTVSHPEDAADALAGVCEAVEGDDPEERVYHEMLERDDGRWVRGTLSLRGDQLHVQANSQERISRLIELVTGTLPDAVLTGTHATPLEQALAEMPVGAEPTPPVPGEQEIIAEYLEQYYDRWLDLDIPALGGLTPRQAADDPTRREDLLRLLATLSEGPGPPAPVQRIRAALNLDPPDPPASRPPRTR